MKVLSIGNSFSQDAQRYLHEVAKSDGYDLQTVNLFIGGCPLKSHHAYMLNGEPAYAYERNGQSTGEMISIPSALALEDWDYITVQQVSSSSAHYYSYFPYITELVEYIRKCCPRAKVMVHETWPYENGSELLANQGFATSAEMFKAVKDCYARASKEVNADGIIPSGTAMNEGINRGVKMHRDTFHAGYAIGRYLLALVWYKKLTGRSIAQNSFRDFDEPADESQVKTIIEIADEVVG